MKSLKHKVDVYFDLQGDSEGQFLYYGMLGLMGFAVIAGTLGNIFS
ncbi:hypothetical protein [Paenibacillus odorifer]|nr:hypothetical protein [Paenibacillus odorifer]